MGKLERIELEDAIAEIRRNVCPVQHTEILKLSDALGFVAAEDLQARIDQPPFARSAMDGYAVYASDIKGASLEDPVILTVADESDAGETRQLSLERGKTVRIMTGAPLPAGADCVVMQEDTDSGEVQASFYRESVPGSFCCRKGEDFQQEEVLITKGTKLGAYELGLAAAMGHDRITVYRRARAYVLTTGDELQEPGMPLQPGRIYNSSKYLLTAAVKSFGMEIQGTESLRDDPVKLAESLLNASERADLILTTGGVSVGKKDYLPEAALAAGFQMLFHGIAVKPGGAVFGGVKGQTLLIGLSGNPLGMAIHMEILARVAVCALTGSEEHMWKYKTAILENSFRKGGNIRRLMAGIYDNGRVRLTERKQYSGAVSPLLGCNCLIDLEAGRGEAEAGEEVRVIRL